MKKFFKTLFFLFGIILLLVACFFGYFTLTDYKPEMREVISSINHPDTIKIGESFSVLTWNIGYAGLDKDMDFFYDGGTKVRPEEKQVLENMEGIASFLKSNDSIDFFLLQEVDQEAKRSYHINQIDYMAKALPKHKPFFSLNYNVKFVPQPITNPMGMVKAGIATYSSFAPSISERYAFPFNFGWPLRIFMLDRCFMTTRLKTSNGKELVLINTHNSAFDDNGSIRKAELGYFRNFLVDEYKKGNYVIVGGDFNQCPVGINTDFGIQPFDFDDYVSIPDSLLPIDWKYIFDNKTPSNRRVATPYKKGETKITLIDFFIVSPNVKAEEIVCVDLDFRHSDHNPVIGKFRLE
ncbi:MAG: endonuclease/exonuclease/phosphatase family protein [Paludibacteraceae bacterium]